MLNIEMSAKVKKVLRKKGVLNQASVVKDSQGMPILEKMHRVAEQALLQSQCTEVPTSLCIEARQIYANQMLYEKNVEKAVSILHDIC